MKKKRDILGFELVFWAAGRRALNFGVPRSFKGRHEVIDVVFDLALETRFGRSDASGLSLSKAHSAPG